MCQRLADGRLLLLCSAGNRLAGAGTTHCVYLLAHHYYIAAITTICHVSHVLRPSTCMQSFASKCIPANVSVFVKVQIYRGFK